MKVLVTGGAGWIGGITTRLLEQRGHEVVVFDNLSTGFKDNIKQAQLIQGDLRDAEAVRKLFLKPYDVIIHFAAKLDVGESIQNPQLYFDNNLIGSLNLLQAAVQSGTKKILFSSSATVYGEPAHTPVSEDAQIQPINPYGFSKLMTEQLLKSYEQTHDLDWIALRYFNPVGGYDGIFQNPTVSNIVPTALRAIQSGKPMQIFGNDYSTPDGTCIRDYVDVVEIAEAHVLAATAITQGQKFNRPLNLGSGSGYTVLEILAAITKATGVPVPYELGSRRTGDAQAVVASNKLADQLLGWKTTSGLDEMVAKAVANPRLQTLLP